MNRVAFAVATVLALVVVVLTVELPPTTPAVVSFLEYSFIPLFILYGAGGFAASRQSRSLLGGAAGGLGVAFFSTVLAWLAGIILDPQFRQGVGVNGLGILPIFLIAGALCGAAGAAARNIRRA